MTLPSQLSNTSVAIREEGNFSRSQMGGSVPFFAPQFLAQILDRIVDLNGNSHYLQGALSGGSAHNLAEALASLGPSQRRVLADRLGENSMGPWCSLSEESDAQIFHSDLYSLSGDLRRQGYLQESASILGFLSRDSIGISQHLRRRAQADFNALRGEGGPLGLRIELLADRFIEEALHPATIGGMALGQLVYAPTRAFFLSRFFTPATGRFILGSLGSRTAASTMGMVAEIPVFWGASKGIQEWMHPAQQPWDWRTNLTELGSLALTLGVLRASGFAAGTAVGWASRPAVSGALPAVAPWVRGAQMALPPAATIGGLYFSHWAEEGLGFRISQGSGNRLLDSVVTFFQFGVSGRIAHGLLGRSFHHWHLQMEVALARREAQGRYPLYSYTAAEGYNLIERLAGPIKTPQRWALAGLRDGVVLMSRPRAMEGEEYTLKGLQILHMSGEGDGYERGSSSVGSNTKNSTVSGLEETRMSGRYFQQSPNTPTSNRYRDLFNQTAQDLQLRTRWLSESIFPLEENAGEARVIMETLESIRQKKVKESIEVNDRVSFEGSLDSLNPAERRAVDLFREEAVPLVNQIFSLQMDSNNLKYRRWLEEHGDENSKILFERHQQDTGVAHLAEDPLMSLLPFFPDPPEISGMFSAGIGLREFQEKTRTLEFNDPILALDTVVFRDEDGSLQSVPMARSPTFRHHFENLAKAFDAIARIEIEHTVLAPSLRNQLDLWARALRSGNYDDSLRAAQATIDQSDGNLRVIFGPIENSWIDKTKGSFSLQVGVRDPEVFALLGGNRGLLEQLERQIEISGLRRKEMEPVFTPVEPIYQIITAGEIGSFPIREISGHAFSGKDFFGARGAIQTIHLEVIFEIGNRIKSSLSRILTEDLTNWDASKSINEFVASHESGHLVGPQATHRNERGEMLGSIFGRYYGGFEEPKADSVAVVLANMRFLNGDLSLEQARDFYRAYVGYQLSNRYRGRDNVENLRNHDFGRLLQVGFMFRENVFRLESKGEENFISINYQGLPRAAKELYLKIIEFQLYGQVQEARRFALDIVRNIPSEADQLILTANKEQKHFFIDRF